MANDYYGKIGFRFRPEIERPDPKWAKKLMEEDYSTPYLSDGMMKLYTMNSEIHQLFIAPKMAGPAVTVKCCSADRRCLTMSSPATFWWLRPRVAPAMPSAAILWSAS